jgi:histidinol-phosphatase (PHP family)
MVDYHTHTALCNHATGEMAEYVEAAIEKGLAELGISCHNPMPDGYDPRHRMTMHKFLSVYKPSVLKLREDYADRIVIRFGIEADYFPGTEQFVEEFLRTHEFDYVIGSVHLLGTWGKEEPYVVQDFDPESADERYIAYYKAIESMARSGLYDIAAHFDLVKKNGYQASLAGDVHEARDSALRAIKENGMSMEINSSGLRKRVGEIYPAENILIRAQELGIPLTTGSDAHTPEDVAADFDKVYTLIAKYGGGKVNQYNKRVRNEMTYAPIRDFLTDGG